VKRKSPHQKWPYVTKDEKRNAYKVDTRTKDGGQRRYFKTREEADAFAVKQRALRANQGSLAYDDAALRKHGWSVADAIKFALKHLEKKAASQSVAKAVEELLEVRRPAIGKRRYTDLKRRLGKFATNFKDKSTREVTPEDINEFLSKFEHPTTRNDYRKDIVLLWHFCRSKRWVDEAIDKNLVPRLPEPEKSRTILTVSQAQALMDASKDPDVRALNAMVMFGGLRREEVEKLDWADVYFKTRHIHVSSSVSKVGRERFAPILPNLRQWLNRISKKTGPIVERDLTYALRRTWKAAGIVPWPADAHRHSFVSYRRRLIGDAQTALDAGTSEAIIKKHYKRPVLKSDAEKFFRIVPGKV
jgi:integrase